MFGGSVANTWAWEHKEAVAAAAMVKRVAKVEETELDPTLGRSTLRQCTCPLSLFICINKSAANNKSAMTNRQGDDHHCPGKGYHLQIGHLRWPSLCAASSVIEVYSVSSIRHGSPACLPASARAHCSSALVLLATTTRPAFVHRQFSQSASQC